jgi:hypothetical protein
VTKYSCAFKSVRDPTLFNNPSYPCYYGCRDGACLPRCTDSDRGKNYFVKGYTKGTDVKVKDSDTLVKRAEYDSCAKDQYAIGSKQYDEKSNELYESFCTPEGYYDSESILCEYGCSDGACLKEPAPPTISEKPNEFVTEKIKCIFKNANTENKCFSSGEEFGCTGIGSCLVDVKGTKGKELTWKSTCGGYATTVIDWNDENALFDCSAPKIKETVTCYFENSASEQKCYIAEDNFDFYCRGIESCSIVVDAAKGKELTWKSTCGGYQYTFQDWNDEKVIFECGKGETNSVSLTGGFKFGYWQCYNGDEGKEGGESSCKRSGLWKKYANAFCKDKCANGRCGVNSFSVVGDCYSDDPTDYGESQQSVDKVEEEVLDENVLVCKDSCPLEGKCYLFGYRKSSQFCSDQGRFVNQLTSEEQCENNFECQSNVCVNNKCVSPGLLESIINWFKKLFGN